MGMWPAVPPATWRTCCATVCKTLTPCPDQLARCHARLHAQRRAEQLRFLSPHELPEEIAVDRSGSPTRRLSIQPKCLVEVPLHALLAAVEFLGIPEEALGQGGRVPRAPSLQARPLNRGGAHYAVAITHSFAGRVERARKAAERAIALSSSFALGHLVLGLCVLLLGNPGEAIRELEHGLRLNPFDPHGFYWRLSLAFAHYIGGEPALGLEEARACLEMLPHWSAALRIAAACQIALGNRIAAHQYVAELEGEGNPGQDLLVNMAAHRPDWVQKVEAALSSVRTETRAVVGSS